jgi:hypothetical protein
MAQVMIKVNTDEFRKSLERTRREVEAANKRAAEEAGKEAVRLYKTATRTWNNQPAFEALTEASASKIEVLVGTDDKVFKYVDEGTSVRRAVMSADWVSKSTPGSLKAGKGRGMVVFISKKISRPGIEARRFTENIKRVIEGKIEEIFNRYLKKVIK